MPKCTINGVEIEVAPGTTIIQAMKKMNQEIAHYCWHPGLSVAGVCRLCMVEIEGNPRLQIACNTMVTDGMKINNTSAQVKDSVRWGMEFHLINHPLDCPICDQAGECGLQEQYMKYGKYDPEMAVPKVKKRKVVDLGDRVVLDSERCILCSRCVRFTSEVSKTNELGIFNRGDHSEIGTFEDKPLNNNYSVNTVDICPVGALTSKDFRFRQRVWYLKTADTICTGCSTGCNVKVSYNKEGLFRVKPRENQEINGYWMCDKGRDVYKFVNQEYRLVEALKTQNGETTTMSSIEAVAAMGSQLKSALQKDGASVVLALTGQYTNEEYEKIINVFKSWGGKKAYHWMNQPEEVEQFDGLLLRGDRNSNTKGLKKALESSGLTLVSMQDLETQIRGGQVKTIVAAGPENQETFREMDKAVKVFSQAATVMWLAPGPITGVQKAISYRGPLGTERAILNKQSPTAAELGTSLPGQGYNAGSRYDQKVSQLIDPVADLKEWSPKCEIWQVPIKTFFEKSGTFVNFKGIEQKVNKAATVVGEALSLSEVAQLLVDPKATVTLDMPEAVRSRRHNEASYERGSL